MRDYVNNDSVKLRKYCKLTKVKNIEQKCKLLNYLGTLFQHLSTVCIDKVFPKINSHRSWKHQSFFTKNFQSSSSNFWNIHKPYPLQSEAIFTTSDKLLPFLFIWSVLEPFFDRENLIKLDYFLTLMGNF